MLCDLLDKKTSLSSLSRPYKKIDLRKLQTFLFSKGLVHSLGQKFKISSSFLFRQKKTKRRCFVHVLYREKTRRCGSVYLGVDKDVDWGGGLKFCVCSGGFEKSVRSRETRERA